MKDIKQLREELKNLKVMFVDDEEQIRKNTGLLLGKFFDEVKIYNNGQEALDAFKENSTFDIIITDIQMPKMDGISMVKKMKEIKKDIFVVFITAVRRESEDEACLCDMYITKPISYEDIKNLMEKVQSIV